MTSNERLRNVVEEIKIKNNFTNEELSAALHYKSDTYISDILGQSKPATKLFLERLEFYFNVNLNYIEKGEGEMFIESNVSDPETSYLLKRRHQKLKPDFLQIPLVNVKAQAGYRKRYSNSDFLNELKSYPILPGVDPHGAIWRYFQVDGDSMLPFLNNGDYVLSNQVPKEDWPEIKDYHVYVIVTEDLVTIKRVFKRKHFKELVLIPENEAFDQVVLNTESIKEIWRYRRHIGWNASSPKKFEIKV